MNSFKKKFFFIFLLYLSFIFMPLSGETNNKKNGEFSGTCASNNPFLKNDSGKCSYCGASSKEECKNEENSSEK